MAEAIPTPLHGLTEVEAAARRAAGQGNTFSLPASRSYGEILRENVFTFINNVLFGLGVALVLVGRPVDAVTSVGIILTNILVSVVQEVRAKRTLDRIALLTRPLASLVREGRERPVPPEELVVGDLVRVGAGDQIVLDGEVAAGRMAVDESQLTGESDLIDKGPGDPVYSGSFAVSGSAHYVVQRVGRESLSNRITAGARAFRRVLTPLQQQIHLVIRIVLLIVIYLELLLLLDSILKLVPLAESVTQATVIASLVPNGLFVSIAIAYALAAVRIVRFGALVQQSNAIESLSNVTLLCLDKTGTLTANRMQLRETVPFEISAEELADALGMMAASASAQNKTGEAIAHALPRPPRRRIAEIPFSSDRKWSAVAIQDGDWSGLYALGAPEMLKPFLAEGKGTSWEAIESRTREMADQGLRVLLAARHPEPGLLAADGHESRLPQGMSPLGLVAFADDLRPEARDTLQAFLHLGVAPKIISGDNPETVAALARQAGLRGPLKTVSGLDLDRMDEGQLAQAAASATVFGRITPQQKERLVSSLMAQGYYVAMIGDGVNDVLSLKKANLGIAMQSGSQATRSVADIILLNDSFSALVPAIAEGQRILNGMQDILKLFLARIATVALVILSSLVIGLFPLGLRHGSIVTLLTVGVPTVMLAFWAQPGARHRSHLGRELAHFVLPASVFSSLLGLLVFYGTLFWQAAQQGLLAPGTNLQLVEQATQTLVPIAQTALATFLILCGLALVIFVEPPTPWWVGGDSLSSDWRPTWLAIALLGVYGLILATPLREAFALAALTPLDLAIVAGAGAVWILVVRTAWRGRWLDRFLGLGTNA